MHCRRNALRGRERTRKALKRRRPHSAAPSPWSSWTENPGRKIWRSEREDDRQQQDKSIMRIQFSFGFVTFPSPSSFAFPNRRSRLSLLFDVVRNQDILGQRSSSSPFSEWRTKENNNNKKRTKHTFFLWPLSRVQRSLASGFDLRASETTGAKSLKLNGYESKWNVTQ